MVRTLTKLEFIEKAKAIHGNKYSYNKVIYKNRTTKIQIFCKKCKEYFLQTPNGHLRGCGCKKCGYKSHSLQLKDSFCEFIEKAKKIHNNKYEYNEDTFDNEKIKIYCKECKKYFYQTRGNHLRGSGCPSCGNKTKGKALDLIIFIKKANEIHNNRYEYEDVIYKNCRTKVKIWCKKCKKFFMQTPSNHLSGKGCPYCMQSKGELQISDWLKIHNISYIFQKRFKMCKDQNVLPFDFYLPDYNLCIEFQGQQHYNKKMFVERYKSLELGTKAFNKQKIHDKIKQNFCKVNKIGLLIIKYDANINDILKKELIYDEGNL